jgi:hypothetical protein
LGLWAVGLAVALSHGAPGHGVSNIEGVFLPAARQVLHGYLQYTQPPYTPSTVDVYRYPPFAAVMFAPFGLFSLHTATYLWWGASVLMVATTALLMSRLFPTHRALASGLLFLGLMSFAPIGIFLRDTPDSWILAAMAGAIVLTHDPSEDSWWRPVIAGALVGVVVAIKLYPALALIVFLGGRPLRARWIIAGFVASLVLTTGLVVALVGIGPFHAYGEMASTNSVTLTAWPEAFGALNIASRLVASNPYAHNLVSLGPHALTVVFVLYVAVVLLFVVFRLRSSPSHWGVPWCLGLAVAAACSPFLEDYHLAPLALIPVLMVSKSQYPQEVAVALVIAAAGCTLVAETAPHHVAEATSVLVAGLGVVYAWHRASIPAALVTGGILLLATPSFAGISRFWPIPISPAHVFIGSLDFIAVLAILAGVLSHGAKRRNYSMVTTRAITSTDLSAQSSG